MPQPHAACRMPQPHAATARRNRPRAARMAYSGHDILQPHAMLTPLPATVSADRFEFDRAAGRLSAYVAGQGSPLLLVHSVNAAASAAEVRPLHKHYRASRTVFSIDLPGYGFSERSDRPYTPRLMTDALHAIVA